MSLKGIIKSLQITRKGYNAILDVTNPLAQTTAAIDRSGNHVPENGGTWIHILHMSTLLIC
jgi:hypothetical protein